MRRDKSLAKDLITNGHGASCSGDSLINGDLVSEHVKKKRKELLGLSPQAKVITFIYAVSKWIKSSHIRRKVRTMLWKNLNVFSSQVHKEMRPGNKRLHFEHAGSLNVNLKQFNVNNFGDSSARNLSTNKEVIDGLLHVQKTLKTKFSGLSSRAG